MALGSFDESDMKVVQELRNELHQNRGLWGQMLPAKTQASNPKVFILSTLRIYGQLIYVRVFLWKIIQKYFKMLSTEVCIGALGVKLISVWT